MDKTKSKLAAFFDNDDEETAFPQKPVDDQKLSQYTQGTAKKSRREKEREAAEARKKEEEENAARAYAEFLDEFEGEGTSRRRTGSGFVRASGDGGGSGTTSASVLYQGSRSNAREGGGHHQPNIRPPSPPQTSAPKPKGKRAMDAFLEEIKRDQAEREARYARHSHARSVTAMAAYEGQSGSKDRGDPETSNLFVANLPPHVTEQSLGYFFARCGPVGSVKIMWPRGEGAGPGGDMTASRRTKSSGLSGFVSFMKRRDAEDALREYDGYDWGGCVLRVGWSKAIPVAAKPLYVASKTWERPGEGHHSPSPSRSRSPPSGARYRSRSPPRREEGRYRSSHRSRSRSWSRSRSRSPPRRRRQRRSRSRSRRRYDSSSRSPYRHRSPSPRRRRHNEEEETVTDTFIRAVAAEIKGLGSTYENTLREREQGNPKYAFMLHKDHRRHVYYKGLVGSEENLDPEFDDEGYNSVYSTDSAEDSERERTRKSALGKLARRRFEAMLRSLTGRRGELARCMAFSLEHAEAAADVSDIIVASLLVEGTPVPRKVARLHLICDILHNSAASVPSAWKFRQEFQARLGIVFDHMSNIYHSFPGRITAETFKKQITTVVDIWEDWIVFPPDFTMELRERLDGTLMGANKRQVEVDVMGEEARPVAEAQAPRFKMSSFKPATATAHGDGEPMDQGSDDDIDGVPLPVKDGKPIEDDIDGVPIDDDIDGVPIDDKDNVDGEPMDDIDGEPMDDIDGEPMEEGDSVDGTHVDT